MVRLQYAKYIYPILILDLTFILYFSLIGSIFPKPSDKILKLFSYPDFVVGHKIWSFYSLFLGLLIIASRKNENAEKGIIWIFLLHAIAFAFYFKTILDFTVHVLEIIMIPVAIQKTFELEEKQQNEKT